MNTKNNKRKQNTLSSIQKALFDLLGNKDIKDISVSDICKAADINRSTFYANYDDISALAKSICMQTQMELHRMSFQKPKTDFTWLFQHIMENREFYLMYFKLCKFTNTIIAPEVAEHTEQSKYYHEFFINGLHSVAELWLQNGCVEAPEEMNSIILEKYNKFFSN